jgi:hypothetical protein
MLASSVKILRRLAGSVSFAWRREYSGLGENARIAGQRNLSAVAPEDQFLQGGLDGRREVLEAGQQPALTLTLNGTDHLGRKFQRQWQKNTP